MRIGLAVIATGKYVEFLPRLKASVDKFFLRGHEVVFLPLHNHYAESDGAWIPHEPWPGPTIHRYHHVLKFFGSLCGELPLPFDYIFMLDADMEFVAPVGDEILGDRVATIHPGYWDKRRFFFPYEKRPESLAHIKSDRGVRYYAGGFQGGRAEGYLDDCFTISQHIELDEVCGVTAVWHDESHWNRYLVENPPDVELDPGYCYPESWDLPFTPRLLALDKNHAEMRA